MVPFRLVIIINDLLHSEYSFRSVFEPRAPKIFMEALRPS